MWYYEWKSYIPEKSVRDSFVLDKSELEVAMAD